MSVSSRRLAAAIAIVVVGNHCLLHANAATIRYSWAGHIAPNGGEDPWQIGIQGRGFNLLVNVVSNAIDQSQQKVEVAEFLVSEAQLIIGSEELSYMGGGNLNFADSTLDGLDLLSFQGEFERNGARAPMTTFVVIPRSGFKLADLSASPPVFGSMINSTRTTSVGPIYRSVVERGAPVLSVSEPHSSVGGLLAIVMLVARRSFLSSRPVTQIVSRLTPASITHVRKPS